MNMNPWKNQIDVINGFDFIRKIEGSVLFEQVCIDWSFCDVADDSSGKSKEK